MRAGAVWSESRHAALHAGPTVHGFIGMLQLILLFRLTRNSRKASKNVSNKRLMTHWNLPVCFILHGIRILAPSLCAKLGDLITPCKYFYNILI